MYTSAYAVRKIWQIWFCTALQGHDRKFHRITRYMHSGQGNYINRRKINWLTAWRFNIHGSLILQWSLSCKFPCHTSECHCFWTNTKLHDKKINIVLSCFPYVIYTSLHLVGKPYRFKVCSKLDGSSLDRSICMITSR